MQNTEKFLIIRFSSFGDVTQSLSIPAALNAKFPHAQIHWVTRHDMCPLLEGHPQIHKIFAYNRKSGWPGLFQLIKQLRAEKYTHVYDAHNNLRSRLISAFLSPQYFIRRSIRRWKRFLLFRLRINKFEMPFNGQRDLLEPLAPWGISRIAPPPPQLYVSDAHAVQAKELLQGWTDFVALAPSAAYFLKRWPKDYWIELIRLNPRQNFALLGGPEDHFLQDIAALDANRIRNFAGRCSLGVSVAVVERAQALVSNDTGLLHVAEQLGKPAIALMGPAPFGFPSRPLTKILQIQLPCRPCSKHGQGPCRNKNFYHECLVAIRPEDVSKELGLILRSPR